MNQVVRRVVTLVAVSLLAISLLGAAGCRKAPQLTPAQLAAGQLPPKHPVDQATAQAKGCNCHNQK